MSDPSSEPKSKRSLLTRALHVVAYPMGALAAYVTADVKMRDHLYKNYAQGFGRFSGMFHSTKEKYLTAYNKISLDHYMAHAPEEGNRVARAMIGAVTPKTFTEKTMGHYAKMLEEQVAKGITSVPRRHALLNEAYSEDVKKFVNGLGVKRIWHFWQEQKRNQKVEAVVFAAGAAAIMIGAILAIAELGVGDDAGRNSSRAAR